MEKVDKISPEDLATIRAAKNKIDLAVAQAQKLASDAKVAELEHRTLVQHVFMKYGLSLDVQINDDTGEIIRPADDANDDVDGGEKDEI